MHKSEYRQNAHVIPAQAGISDTTLHNKKLDTGFRELDKHTDKNKILKQFQIIN